MTLSGAKPNFKNRTLWTGDNIDVMRGMNSDCADLIYLDPPFNSNQEYAAPIGSEAAGAAFKDTWTLSDVDEAWHGEIAERDPALYSIIDAAEMGHGKGMKAYLIMMAVRLLEMRRLLKPTGSIYLHCDPTASHYLKVLMDGIFGRVNYRNEITWKRTSAHSDPKRFGRIADTIFFYTMSDRYTFNKIRVPYSSDYIESNFRYRDKNGPYRLGDLTGPRLNPNDEEWRGYHPASIGRSWSVPRRLVEKHGGEEALKLSIPERLELLYEAGVIVFSESGIPSFKSHLDILPGAVAQSIWTDIPPVSSRSKERVGYPTQKPLALLDRIIRASSNEGDMIFDPFCGCATALVAADRLNREWAGVDLSPIAAKLVLQRIRDDRGELFDDVVHRTDIPTRTDLDTLPNYKTHRHTLFGRQEGACNGCLHHFPFRNMTVDHIVPKAKGGHDNIENLQLLCGACNSTKGTLTQEEFIARLKQQGIRN